MESLYRISYYSVPRKGLVEEDLKAICRSAIKNNTRDNISGFLAFHKFAFLQVLEGSRQALTSCFMRIGHDPRHTDVVLMEMTAIDRRAFGRWNMGYLALTDSHNELVARYCVSKTLSPAELTPQGALLLLQELAEQVNLKMNFPAVP